MITCNSSDAHFIPLMRHNKGCGLTLFGVPQTSAKWLFYYSLNSTNPVPTNLGRFAQLCNEDIHTDVRESLKVLFPD